VAVTDSSSGVHNDAGLDPEKLVAHKLKTGSLKGFTGSKPISNKDLLELDIDVLYPAALEGVITSENAPRIKAKVVCELANGPTTPEADAILFKRDIHVIPDFLANAGGVTVSYFEQVQNTYNYYWPMGDVHKLLDDKMTNAYRTVYAMSREQKVHMRLAAYMVAVDRVAKAMKLRGWV
jgi:glutamate dehydrogenase (NAD(P)+)